MDKFLRECRFFIYDEVLQRNKINCPACGETPLMGSSDAIVKLRRLQSAGEIRKSNNKRTLVRSYWVCLFFHKDFLHINLFNRIEKEEPRFGYIAIKSDVEVEAFRQRISITNEIQLTSSIMNVSFISSRTFLFNFMYFYSLDENKADVQWIRL